MKSYSVNWNDSKFKKALAAHLMKNAEIVGEFLEQDARKRLLAITTPEWGRGYREQIVSRLLTNKVVQEKNQIVILLGVKKSKDGRHHGFYIELGSSTAPAHPFLRPAVFGNAQKILALLEGK